MECDTGWILCGGRAWRKRRQQPFVKWVRSARGLTVAYVSRMTWFDNSHSLWTLTEPRKPVAVMLLLQLSHDPLSGTKYHTFVGSDWISCVVLVWISLKSNQKLLLKHFSQAVSKPHEKLASCKIQEEKPMWTILMQSRKTVSGSVPGTDGISYTNAAWE